jgi:hypothetical protein
MGHAGCYICGLFKLSQMCGVWKQLTIPLLAETDGSRRVTN